MSDLITVSCPSCGGKLHVVPESASLACPNCGNGYMLRRDAFGRDREERNRVARRAWEHAMARWSRSYYSARDDCAFIPGEKQAVPLAEVREYLYR